MAKGNTRKPHKSRERRANYRAPRPALTRSEQRALADFRARLKSILPAGALQSLILYGSKARGEAHPYSDVDLLLVHNQEPEQAKDAIFEAELETASQFDPAHPPDLQTLIMTRAELDEASAQGLPLLQNIAREGIVLEGAPVMPEKMDREYYASDYIAKAKRTLKSARGILADGDINNPIAMAFFIYEAAARAGLIAKDIAPQSHTGTLNLFSQHFVKPGLVDKKFGARFKRMLDDRIDATYAKEKQFTKEDAERALDIAEELVNKIDAMLPSLLKEKPS
ncbi:MAG: HEPN domain-containing protein [Chloroflexi bacterium]|nr:HEPN domain-containing protein [Chloroflexota bacterium]